MEEVGYGSENPGVPVQSSESRTVGESLRSRIDRRVLPSSETVLSGMSTSLV